MRIDSGSPRTSTCRLGRAVCTWRIVGWAIAYHFSKTFVLNVLVKGTMLRASCSLGNDVAELNNWGLLFRQGMGSITSAATTGCAGPRFTTACPPGPGRVGGPRPWTGRGKRDADLGGRPSDHKGALRHGRVQLIREWIMELIQVVHTDPRLTVRTPLPGRPFIKGDL